MNSTQDTLSPPRAQKGATRLIGRQQKARRLMGILHLWLGLGLAFYLCAVCVTGTLLVFAPEIARVLEPKLFAVEKGGQPASLEAVRAGVKSAYPNASAKELALFRSFPEWHGLHRFSLEQSGKPIYVYVDPFTARVRGAHSYRETFLGQCDEIHVSLTLGAVGFILNGVGGLLSCVLLGSGLWLWWPGVKNFGKRLAGRLWPRRGGPIKKQMLEWHNTIGFWFLGLLLIVCLSGSLLIFGGPVKMLVGAITRQPIEPPVVKLTEAQTRGPKLSVDELWERARAAVPNAPHLYFTSLAAGEGQVAEFTLYYPDKLLGTTEWATVWLNPRDGKVLALYDLPNENVARRVTGPLVWGAHIGNWLGMPGRVLYGMAGIVPVLLSISGFWIWGAKIVGRRRAKARRAG